MSAADIIEAAGSAISATLTAMATLIWVLRRRR